VPRLDDARVNGNAAGAKSLREIATALNGRGVATAYGGQWDATTVRNILRRAA
jgi:Recombinase